MKTKRAMIIFMVTPSSEKLPLHPNDGQESTPPEVGCQQTEKKPPQRGRECRFSRERS